MAVTLVIFVSKAGGFLREASAVQKAIKAAARQEERLMADGMNGLSGDGLADAFRTRQLCVAQRFYLEAIRRQIECIGSRGGSVVLPRDGVSLLPMLGDEWRIMPENAEFRQQVMICRRNAAGGVDVTFEECRPVPSGDGWFENVWREYREGEIYR